jgi:hypothetical protein
MSLNLIAITVFLLTLSTLLGPLINLSPMVSAVATCGVLGWLAIDSLVLQGQGSEIALDWMNNGRSSDRQLRVIRHEAGHFLVAHSLGIPVADYTLTAWETLQRGYRGRGGVQFDDRELAAQLQKGTLSAQLLDRYCQVWMGGIAAETLVYGNASGGGDDRLQLQRLFAQLRPPITNIGTRERQSVLQAKTILENHWLAYEALVEAMRSRRSVVECCQLLDEMGNG